MSRSIPARTAALLIAVSVVTLLPTAFYAAAESAKLTSAINTANVPKKKKTSLGLYLTAKEAGKVLASDKTVHFIDVRSLSEVQFVGIPTRANQNIPFMMMPQPPKYNPKKGGYTLAPNPDFAKAVAAYFEKHKLAKDTRVLLMCRSGGRSAKAVNALAKLGYTQVYSVIDGFEGDKNKAGRRQVNGWKNAGLKWNDKIRPAQVYTPPRR